MSQVEILEGLYSRRLNEGKDECVVPICFGYEIWKIGNKFEVLNGEGDTVYTADSTFDAKKWCKEHKTSTKWRADSKWDWNRESKNPVSESKSSKKYTGKNWKEFVKDIESKSDYSVKDEKVPVRWLTLYKKNEVYMGEVTRYSDGYFELMGYNIHKA